MKVLDNVDLSKKTTFHVGGVARKFYIPESQDELIETAEKLYNSEEGLYIISGGSNLIINDERVFPSVVSMSGCCCEMESLEDETFYIGASNRIQKVIHYLNELGYGGFEELIGLPALFGGIIYMNAGIGGKNNCLFTISDFVINVIAYDLKKHCIVKLDKSECNFSHRCSVFKNGEYLILGANIKPKKQDKSLSLQKIKKRQEFCKKRFEYGKGCFGTLFSKCTPKILKGVSILIKHIGDVSFAKNNANWLVNSGNATFKDTKALIRICSIAHRIVGKKTECEVVIWE